MSTTHDQIREALSYVPPTDRETWLRVGMAVKAEIGDDGFDLWDSWSQADETYAASDARSVWKSIKSSGKVTIGTLFHEAKARGWTHKANGNGHAAVDAEDLAERQRRREQEAQKEQEQRAQAKRQAAEIWAAAKPAPETHPYLARKAVKPHGLRIYHGDLTLRDVAVDGALVMPLRDANGELHSLEFITAAGEKRMLYGGRKSGCYFAIGTPAGAIIIAEGFTTGASIHEATGQAVAVAVDCYNLRNVAETLREKLSDVRLIIGADDDYQTEGNPGRTKANECAQAVGATVVTPVFGPDRPDGAKDFNDMARIRGVDAVGAVFESALAADQAERLPESSATQPEPLRRPLPPAEEYPMDALGDVLGTAAKRLAETVQAPAALCGQSILAAASLAVQAHADVLIDGRWEPLSLFHVTIAESGERKSAADALALRVHREYERKELQRYAHDKAMYEVELQAFESASRAMTRGKNQQEIKGNLCDLGAPPEPPLLPLLLVGTPTMEGIHKLYAVGRPTLGLFHDDAAEFLGGHAMNNDNRTKSAAGLSKLWDRGEFDRVRSGDGAEKFFGRRLAMHLMMQPVIAETVLSDDVLTGQGFLARSLLAWPTSTIGTRRYREIDLTRDTDMLRYWARMEALLTRGYSLRPDTRNELEPRTLTLTPAAKRRYIAIHNLIEADMLPGGDFASVRAWASKSPAQALRIAGVLTLVDDAEAMTISEDALDRAATLMQFYLSEAVRIVGTSSVPAPVRRAEALLEWCHSSGRRLLHSSAALQFGPAAIRTREAFDEAIAELQQAGWAQRIDGGCEVDGAHRRRVWAIWGRR